MRVYSTDKEGEEMYLILTKFTGGWVLNQVEHMPEALQVYSNQASKVGIWAGESMLIEGTILKSITQKEVLKSQGYPIGGNKVEGME